MLFNEIYGCYYQAVAAIINEALRGTLSEARMNEIIRSRAFDESVLAIVPALRSGSWPFLDAHNHTPLQHMPNMPLTLLQKRWLKALLQDPRILLFAPSCEGLEDVEPLFSPETFCYFDRYLDGDPYNNSAYISHFRTVVTALQEKRKLRVVSLSRHRKNCIWECVPEKLEYSAKDDKFRLIAALPGRKLTVNLARVKSCELLEGWSEAEYCPGEAVKNTLVLEVKDERNALERAMLHFSHLQKSTECLGNDRYLFTVQYDCEDETEMLIRVLAFGPLLKVVAPPHFVKKVKERLFQQKKILTSPEHN